MNLNPREWRWSRESFLFNKNYRDPVDVGFSILMFGIIGAMVLFVPWAVSDAIFLPEPLAWTGWAISTAATAFIHLWLPAINKLNKVSDKNLRAYGYAYFALPNKDKALFPANFVDMLNAVEFMDGNDAYDFRREVSGVFSEIDDRNRTIDNAKAMVKTNSVDAKGMIERMKQAREHAAIEARTMKEYL